MLLAGNPSLATSRRSLSEGERHVLGERALRARRDARIVEPLEANFLDRLQESSLQQILRIVGIDAALIEHLHQRAADRIPIAHVGELIEGRLVGIGPCRFLGRSVVERTRLPCRQLWAVLLVAPLTVPPFVTSYAWANLGNPLQGLVGAAGIVAFSYFPIVYLLVAVALRGLDPKVPHFILMSFPITSIHTPRRIAGFQLTEPASRTE